MNKYLILSSLMGAGKDSVARKLIKDYGFKSGISHATRPMRSGEINGVDYFFVTKDKFHDMINNGEFVETRSYITKVEHEGRQTTDMWWYGLSKQQIMDRKKPIVLILDKQGAEDFINYVGEDSVVWVLLECDEGILRQRALNRGDYEDEISRRFKADKRSFKGIENCVHSVINTEMELDRVVESVKGVYDYYNEL